MPLHPRSLLRTLTVACHRALGACAFRAGALEQSRRHLERILELTGDDFGAYVRLALIAYRLGDYSSWRRECGHARRTDPRRYAELRHPFELFECPGDRDTGDALPWRRAFRVSHVGSSRGGQAQEPADPIRSRDAPEGTAEARLDRPDKRIGDDFSSEVERGRFRGLDPLTIEDVREADLEDLARRFGS